MNEFILAWVLITVNYGYGNSSLVVYSTPVKTIQDCELIQKSFIELSNSKTNTSKCIQINVLKKASKK